MPRAEESHVRISSMSKKVTRLFRNFQPSNYQLSINPNKDSLTFTGSIVIRGKKTGPPSRRLTFHQKNLKISGVEVVHIHKNIETELKTDRINVHKSSDEIRLHFKDSLKHGEYRVSMKFSGKITSNMEGLYPCNFKHQGKPDKLLATQFESHHAREVFPCIDEPEAKATFDLTVQSAPDDTVLGNTPVESETTDKNLKTTVFETSPLMSTYLLAFVVGNVEHKQTKTKSGTIIRAYSTPDKIDQVDFALSFAKDCLEFYDEYFGIPYPLEKCDLIALPDFASGAMENWGLITFREQCMLVDNKHTSLSNKQYVAMVVAHELAHQWFGNLVTMRWWTDLWLNEGFASWIEYMAVDKIFPGWKMWEQFVTDEQQTALKQDSLINTHPIEAPINHPDEIRTIFDAISYSKGSSVIHMLHGYLGAQNFRDGLRYYLQKHAYKNTVTDDLWEALEEISKKPVKEFMHAWTTQPGFPIVHAEVSEDQLKLRQDRFIFKASGDADKKELGLKWPVPILASQGNIDQSFKLREFKQKIKNGEELKINSGQTGFYRTVYNASHTHHLASQIKRGHLSPTDRLGLLADIFEASKAGFVDIDDALDLLGSFENETDAAVWDVMVRNIGELKLVMGFDTGLRELIKPFSRKLSQNLVEKLGWEAKKNETHFDSLLRPTILGMAAVSDNPKIVEHALKLFDEIKDPDDLPDELADGTTISDIKNSRLDPDIRGVVYGTAARKGDEKTFNKLLKLYDKCDNSEEQLNLAAALCNFRQKSLINRALDIIRSDRVRHQDVAYWVAYSFMNHHSSVITWEWMKSNWGWLEEHLGTDLGFSRFPVFAARVFSNQEFLKEYRSFFGDKKTPTLKRSILQGEEIILWHIDWRERALKETLAFFEAKN